jgi:hypothetical protein
MLDYAPTSSAMTVIYIFASVVVDEPDDWATIAVAKRLVDDHDVELWQRDRRIAKFKCEQDIP